YGSSVWLCTNLCQARTAHTIVVASAGRNKRRGRHSFDNHRPLIPPGPPRRGLFLNLARDCSCHPRERTPMRAAHLYVYPIKSCGGVEVDRLLVSLAGVAN